MKALKFLLFFLFTTIGVYAQNTSPEHTLFGNVFNQDGEDLIGATVQWDGTAIGTITDENGNFWIPKMDTTANLLIQYVGYEPVYIEMYPHEDTAYIKIEGVTELAEIEVTGQGTDNYTSTLNPINLEQISSGELRKAACCNLSESFETNGAVDVMSQDAVTSTREIQMLGLRGVYTQLLMEKRPAYTGLGWPHGLDFIPGTWVSGIQISKGASTVQNGPQSIAGQINTELVKPFEDKPLFLNLFGSTVERGEINLHLNHRWNEAWSSGVLLHGSTTRGTFDRNGDTFQDQPEKRSLNGLFRTFYRGDLVRSQINLQVIDDEREGGQLTTTGTELYRINQRNKRIDLFGKIGFLGFSRPGTSLGLIYNTSWHDTDNHFGRISYSGTQKSLYANLIYSTILGTTEHTLNTGVSYQHDDYEEFLNESDFSREERMPGVFAEYAYNPSRLANSEDNTFWQNFGIITGLRIDHHSQHGYFVIPRINLKYNFTDNSIVRFSAGRGVRTAQILSENMAVLTANRQIVANQAELDIEDAWNYGMNYTQNFEVFGKKASFVADVYHTEFRNQVVVDMESEQGAVLFYNLDGRSFANSVLILGSMELLKGLDMKLAYKFNDVKITYNEPNSADEGELRERPLTARHRALATLDYETPDEKWMVNTNIQFTGRQRFTDEHHLPADLPDREFFTGYSPSYTLLNAQVTRRFKNWELYVGGENLTNYTQEHAIIDWEHPFGEDFNAMQVYAPLVGARGYVGIRMWLD